MHESYSIYQLMLGSTEPAWLPSRSGRYTARRYQRCSAFSEVPSFENNQLVRFSLNMVPPSFISLPSTADGRFTYLTFNSMALTVPASPF